MNVFDLATEAEAIRDKLLLKPDLTDTQRGNLISFKASNGFIQKFNQRHNIHFKKFSGEAGSVDDKIVDDWKKVLKFMIKDISPDCIANADETGLNWKSTRGKSFITGDEHIDSELRGQKQSKERLTVLVSAFLSG